MCFICCLSVTCCVSLQTAHPSSHPSLSRSGVISQVPFPAPLGHPKATTGPVGLYFPSQVWETDGFTWELSLPAGLGGQAGCLCACRGFSPHGESLELQFLPLVLMLHSKWFKILPKISRKKKKSDQKLKFLALKLPGWLRQRACVLPRLLAPQTKQSLGQTAWFSVAVQEDYECPAMLLATHVPAQALVLPVAASY